MLLASDPRLPEPYRAVLNAPDWIDGRLRWFLLGAVVVAAFRWLTRSGDPAEGGLEVLHVWHTLWLLAQVAVLVLLVLLVAALVVHAVL